MTVAVFSRIPGRIAGSLYSDPRALLAWTICIGTLVRVLLAAEVADLGHSEAYYIATSRHLALSYFDHPPLSFWISWAAMQLTGSDAVLVVRAPFILLFIGTTLLLFRLTAFLFGQAAGACAALLLNLSPLFSISFGSWVQPDGPLVFCLLAASCCIVRLAFDETIRRPNLVWAQAGIWFGLAMLSKYYAILLPVGVALFAMTSSRHRHWLREPGPYIAGMIAVVLFSPVLIWNYQNDWVSFGFQGHRVLEHTGINLRWFGDSILGQLALIGPWIWIPMLLVWTRAIRDGMGATPRWLLTCIGTVPIVFFTAIALRVPTGGHYHWQAPGYLMLLPLLGKAAADKLGQDDTVTKRWLAVSTAAMLFIAAVMSLETATGWAHLILRNHSIQAEKDPTLKGLEWKELRTVAASRGFLSKPRLFVVTAHRVDIGKVDLELGDALPVVCLCPDPRDVAFGWDPRQFAGWDALIIGTQEHIPDVQAAYGRHFEEIQSLGDIDIVRGGRPALRLKLSYARNYLGSYVLPLGPSAERANDR